MNHSSILAWSCKELDMTEQLSQLSLWSNSHLTNGKAIALTTWTFVSKVMSLLFNVLLKLVIAFLSPSGTKMCVLIHQSVMLCNRTNYFSIPHYIFIVKKEMITR